MRLHIEYCTTIDETHSFRNNVDELAYCHNQDNKTSHHRNAHVP